MYLSPEVLLSLHFSVKFQTCAEFEQNKLIQRMFGGAKDN